MNASRDADGPEDIIRTEPLGYEWPGAYFVGDEELRLVSEVILFDVYSGKQVVAGKKSLAYRFVYQSPTHTLTDEEVNKVQEQILDRLSKELRATLRD